MGFLGFLKKGKKADRKDNAAGTAGAPAFSANDATDAIDIRLEDVTVVVEKQISHKLSDERKHARNLYMGISDGLADVRRRAAELEKKSFEKGDKTYAMVNMLKDNYVKKAASLIPGLPRINDFNYDATLAFNAGTRKILNELLNIPPKQAVLLTRYFKNDASKIIATLKETDAACTELASLLEGSNLMLYSRLKKDVAGVYELACRAEEFATKERALSEKIAAKNKEAGEQAGEAAAFASGPESAKHTSLENEIKLRETERTELGNRLNDELSSLKRPVKKLEHAIKDDKQKAALYSRLSHSPLKVLLNEGDSAIMEALAKLREMGLKDEDREHAEELTKKLELGYLSELADRYKWLENEIAEKKSDLEKSGFPGECRKRERGAESAKHEAAGLEEERSRVLKSKFDADARVKNARTALEELVLRKINIRFNITL
jgi:hypothetical protein